MTKQAISHEARDLANTPVIPEGWVLLPREPTSEMLMAGMAVAISDLSENNLIYSDKGGAVHYTGKAEYQAMINAAPECPSIDFETQVMEAVARGWCSPENSHKTMDGVLAAAITKEVVRALKTEQP